jgi:hypothetical protein
VVETLDVGNPIARCVASILSGDGSTLVMEMRTVRFAGKSVMWSRIHAETIARSCVGSQCRTVGVRRTTSTIKSR